MAINTIQVFDLDGIATRFPVPFEYLARKFVKVTLLGVDRKPLVLVTQFVFEGGSMIRTLSTWGPIVGYTQIEIRRETSATERLVDFNDATILRASDMNTSEMQSIHIAEEARNSIADVLGLDANGNLDARFRRVVNVANPIGQGDAVNMRTLMAIAGDAPEAAIEARNAAADARAAAIEAWNAAVEAGLLKSVLGSPLGTSLIGFGERDLTAKLKDFTNWDDFMLPEDGNRHDMALVRAIESGAKKVWFKGNRNIMGHVAIPAGFELEGAGRESQITFIGPDTWFSMYGTRTAITQGIEMGHLTLAAVGDDAPHIYMDWARQIKFTKCFIYHCGIQANHMNFWNMTDCEVYNSTTTVRYTQDAGEDNQVSGAPRITACFYSESPIVLEDCVDLQISNSHFFQRGISSRLVNWVNKGEGGSDLERPKSTFIIEGSFFDSIYGTAWDFWDVGLSSFMGNFVSAGRQEARDGAYFYRGWHNKFIGNTFVYCGAYGLDLESCESTRVIGNDFIGNKDGGLRTVGGVIDIKIIDNGFGNTPSVYGGTYVQPIGYTDINNDGVGIRFMGNTFKVPSDMAQQVNLTVNHANRNIICDNDGVHDVVAYGRNGTTAERPTGVQAGYGPYYDGTLGIPLWWSGTAWRNASGVVV